MQLSDDHDRSVEIRREPWTLFVWEQMQHVRQKIRRNDLETAGYYSGIVLNLPDISQIV